MQSSSSPDLRTDLDRKACREIEAHYSLDRVVEMELDLISHGLKGDL
ncbi:MAG: hypothetical protein ACK4Z6_01425 [Candidatus Methylomirabilales bacterium]